MERVSSVPLSGNVGASVPRVLCSSSDLGRVAGTRLCGDCETVTLAEDCGDVELVRLVAVAGSRVDWTEEGGMDSRAGGVGGSMVTRYDTRWGWN
jgi:hypothetical protein